MVNNVLIFMDNEKLPLRSKDNILLAKIYETMTSEGRTLSMKKYYAVDQGELKDRTEAYHFQYYKNELFNGAQKRKLDNLLKSQGIKNGIKVIERLPTENATSILAATAIFECFAESKGISQPECLLEFLELCDKKNFPLVAFGNDLQGLKNTIKSLKKYIADSKNKPNSEQNSAISDINENVDAIMTASSNIELVTGETKWLDPYNHDELPLVGREQEFEQLNQFVEHEDQFKIWAIAGPSGAGKTRLAIQWALNSPVLADWNRRVLHKEDRTEPEHWNNWLPVNPTLIIIDYMYGFDEVVLKLINYRLKPTVPKIRVLLIDHVFSEPLHSDKRWRFSGDKSSLNRNEKYFYDLKPLDLQQTQNQEEIIKFIIAHRARIDKKSTQVYEAHEYLQNTRGAYHPLFAALVGDAIKSGENFTVWNRRELIDYYLSGVDRLPWTRGNNSGRWASHFIAVATARRGIGYRDLIDAAENCAYAPEHFGDVKEICQKVITDDNSITLTPFEPDLLGESFFLKFLQFLAGSNKYQAEFRQIFMAGNEDTQTEDAIEFIAFIQRLKRNLLNNDQSQNDMRKLWDMLFDLMNPSDFGNAEPIKWALTVGLIDIADEIKDQFSEKEMVNLLKKIEPAVLYHVNNESFLEYSVFYCMIYFELTQKFKETITDFSEEMRVLFDRYEANNIVDGGTPLMTASYYGFNKMISALIAYGTNIDATVTSSGRNALMIASAMGNTESVKYLLNAENINTVDNEGNTAFILASCNGHIETVKMLLDEGANIDAVDHDGSTALIWASINGHIEMVRLLLGEGANIDAADKEKGRTALIWTSVNGYIPAVRLLLDKGAKIDAIDNEGRTALIWASISGKAETVMLLLDEGANIDAVDHECCTALICASINGHIETVRLLLAKQVELNAVDIRGLTAAQWASFNGHVEIIRLLLDKGVEIDATDKKKGLTVLMLASANGHTKTVRLLLDEGANIDAFDHNGGTALIWACLYNHIEVIQLLLKQKARIDVVDNSRQTALSIATAKGHKEIVQLLIDYGAKINTNFGYDNGSVPSSRIAR